MPKKVFVKGKGFKLINTREEPVYRSMLGLMYDWRVVTKDPLLKIPDNEYVLSAQIPSALGKFLSSSKDGVQKLLHRAKRHLSTIKHDRRVIKEDLVQLSVNDRWIKIAEERVAEVQRTLTDAEHVTVKFAKTRDKATAYDINGTWKEKGYDYNIRVIQPCKTWWKDVYQRGLHIVYDKYEAYPLDLTPYEEKARKDGTELYNCTWYELRETGGPRVFSGFLATRVSPDGKKRFMAISEKRTGALMKLTSKINRWEEMEEKRKNTVVKQVVTIEVDETSYQTETELHKYLAKTLNFPEYYSETYDELSEVLEELVEPVHVKWTARLFSPWLFVDCLRRASELNQNLKFEVVRYKDSATDKLTLDNLV